MPLGSVVGSKHKFLMNHVFRILEHPGFNECELVKNIFLGQIKIAISYSEKLELEPSVSIIGPIVFSGPPKGWIPNQNCPQYINIQWQARCVLSYFGMNPSRISQEFYLIILKSFKPSWASGFCSIINSSNTANMDIKLFIKAVNSLYRQFQPIFTALMPSLDAKLDVIEPKNLFKIFGIDLLGIKLTISDSLIQHFPMDIVNSMTLPLLLSYLIQIRNVQISTKIQYLVSFTESSLSKSDLFGQISPFPLTNSSISKKKHFIDIVSQPAQTLLITRSDSDGFEFIGSLKVLQPYVFLSVYESLRTDPTRLLSLCKKFYKNNDDSIAFDFMNRYINESSLIIFITHLIGMNISSYDIQITSIPRLLLPILSQIDYDKIAEFSQVPILSLDDFNLNIDFGFIFAFGAISLAIQIIVNDVIDFEKATFISDLLSLIEIEPIRKSIVWDIFSLVFLCNSKGDYICDVPHAEAILMSLSSFMNESSFFNSASEKLVFANVKRSKDLTTSLVSPQYALVEMIQRGEYDVAMQIAKRFSGLMSIVHLSMLMKQIQVSISFEDPISESFEIEYFFSYNKHLCDDYHSSGIVQNLMNKRKNDTNPLEISMNQTICKGIEMFSNAGNVCSSNLEHNFSLFSSFLDYLLLYNRIIPYTSHSMNRVSPIEIVHMIVKNNSIEDARNLTMLLGPNAIELVLRYSSTFDIRSKLFNLIASDSTPTGKVIFYAKIMEKKYDASEIRKLMFTQKQSVGFGIKGSYLDFRMMDSSINHSDTIFENYLSGLLKSNEGYGISIIGTESSLERYFLYLDESLQEPSSDTLKNLLLPFFDDPSLNYELMNECYIRLPKYTLCILKEHVYKLTPDIVCNLYPFMGLVSPKLLKVLGIQTMEPKNVIISLFGLFEIKTLVIYVSEFQFEHILNDFLYNMESEKLFFDLYRKAPQMFYLLSGFLSKEMINNIEKYIITEYENSLVSTISNEEGDNIMFSTLYDHYSSKKCMSTLLVLLKDVKRLCSPVFCISCEQLSQIYDECTNVISSLSISSFGFEQRTSINLKRILYYLSFFNSSSNFTCSSFSLIFKQIELISKFVGCSLFSRYQESYSLNNCFTLSEGKELALLSEKYDHTGLLYDICILWSIDLSIYYIPRLISCFRIGLLDEGLRFIEFINKNGISSLLIDQISDSIQYPTPMGAPIQCDDLKMLTELINLKVIPIPSVYEAVRSVSDGIKSIQSMSPPIIELKRVYNHIGEIWRYIVICINRSMFDEAFNIWKCLDQKFKKPSNFTKCIVTPAISGKNWVALWEHISKNDDYFYMFQSYINELFSFLENHGMHNTLFDIQTRLYFYDDAIKTVLYVYKYSDNWNSRLKAILVLIDSIEKSLKFRTNQKILRKEIFTRKDLMNLKNRAEFQNKLIKYCQDSQLSFKPNIDIIGDNQDAMYSVVLMMRMGQIDFVLDLMPELASLFTFEEVCDNVIQALEKSGEGAIPRFFKLISKTKGFVYEICVMVMVGILFPDHNDRTVLSFIKNNVFSEIVRGKLFCKYGYIDESFAIAKSTSNHELILQVLELAKIKGNIQIINKCTKMLK